MNKEQLHRYVSESAGNESNICQKVTIPRIKAAMKLNCVSEKEIDIKL